MCENETMKKLIPDLLIMKMLIIMLLGMIKA